jgi:hypothetical protein
MVELKNDPKRHAIEKQKEKDKINNIKIKEN